MIYILLTCRMWFFSYYLRLSMSAKNYFSSVLCSVLFGAWYQEPNTQRVMVRIKLFLLTVPSHYVSNTRQFFNDDKCNWTCYHNEYNRFYTRNLGRRLLSMTTSMITQTHFYYKLKGQLFARKFSQFLFQLFHWKNSGGAQIYAPASNWPPPPDAWISDKLGAGGIRKPGAPTYMNWMLPAVMGYYGFLFPCAENRYL